MSRPGLPPLTPLAELLAADQGAASSESQRPVLLFDAGDELFAIDARIVELVVGRRFVAPLPQPLGDAIGVCSVQGRMRLVVDLVAIARPLSARWHLIVLHGDTQLALRADYVHGVRTVLEEEIQGEAAESRFLGKIAHGARTARLLDPERIVVT